MHYWIFQAVPERYKLTDKMPNRPGEDGYITRYEAEISPGDVVYCWQAGKNVALHEWGLVDSAAFTDDGGDRRMRTTYERLFSPPLTI